MKYLSLLALALSLSSCIIYQPYPVNQPKTDTPPKSSVDTPRATISKDEVNEIKTQELLAEIDSEVLQQLIKIRKFTESKKYEIKASVEPTLKLNDNQPSTTAMNKSKSKSKVNSIKPLIPKPIESCSNLPSRCSGMTSCRQAMKALQCGYYRLDGDGDGIPCESICR